VVDGALEAAPLPIAPEEVDDGLLMPVPDEPPPLLTPGVIEPELMALGADDPGVVAPGVGVEAPGVIVPVPVEPLFMPPIPFVSPEVAPPVGFAPPEPIAPGLVAPPAPAPAPPAAGAWASAVDAAAMAAVTASEIKTLRMMEVPFLRSFSPEGAPIYSAQKRNARVDARFLTPSLHQMLSFNEDVVLKLF
jgi:hypothetical protein